MSVVSEARFLVEKERKKEKMSSVWEKMCARLKEKSVEEQSEPQEDLLDYCRLWEIHDQDEWHKRWINHPKEHVRNQILKAMKEPAKTFAYNVTLEETMHIIAELWKEVKEYERTYRGFISTMAEADSYFLTSLRCCKEGHFSFSKKQNNTLTHLVKQTNQV